MSFFAPPLTGAKADQYAQLNQQIGLLIGDERDFIANMANMAALLFHQLADLNWAGFYRMKDGELVLGPFQGKPACIRIPLGKGVCGTAAATRVTQVVPDVHAFPGHIACDADSRSEIVVPLIADGRLIGVLDLDSPKPGRFDEDDRAGLEAAAGLLLAASQLV
ncbi:diguanylate cyclase [Sphingomonas sp. IBVSS1]|nr:diguanylate cyclase [Sphingomonas sp. IBVSS1]